jgi:hypothetical protein
MIHRPAYRLGLALSCVLAISLPACGGGGGGGDDEPDAPNCANISGDWGITGACGADICTFTQSGCSITQLSCDSGAFSTSGSLDGNSFTYTGESGAGVPATCDGTINGDAFSGTCNVAGAGTCAFSGTRL